MVLLQLGIGYFPIYIAYMIMYVILFVIRNRKMKIKELINNLIKAQSFLYLIFLNYTFYYFAFGTLPNFIGKISFNILISFYLLIIFSLMKKSLIRFGTHLQENKLRYKHKKYTLIIIARVIICYLMSFMIGPFLNFESDNIGKYFLILSYSNNLIALLTGKNIITDYMIKTLNYIFNKYGISLIKTEVDETILQIQKIIFGVTLDIIFITTIKLIYYHLWSAKILLTNCYFPKTKSLGTFMIITSNLMVTFMVFGCMFLKKKTYLSYKGNFHWFMNIYSLLFTHVLFECNLSFYSKFCQSWE